MNLPEIFDTLTSAGFTVTVNQAHTALHVSLNRTISLLEVEIALAHTVNRSRMARTGHGVTITE